MIKGIIQDQRPNVGYNFERRGNKSQNSKRRADVLMDNMKDLINDLRFGSKYCFYVGKFTEEEKMSLGKQTGYISDEDSPEEIKTKLRQNWWTFEIWAVDDNEKIALHSKLELESTDKIISAYKSFETNPDAKNDKDKKCRINIYGTVSFDIDFSNIGILKEDGDNGAKFPCGAIFFSDSRNTKDMIKGRIGCVEEAAKQLKQERNDFFEPLEDPKFNLHSLIKTNGRLCIFYVDSEETDGDGTDLYPRVKFIEILISALRNRSDTNRNGFIEKMFVSRVEEKSELVESVEDYIITNAFAKNETEVNSDIIIHNAADYIWLVGKNWNDFGINETGFSERRADLNLNPTQHYIGEEYRKTSDFKKQKRPKKFEKTEVKLNVAEPTEIELTVDDD